MLLHFLSFDFHLIFSYSRVAFFSVLSMFALSVFMFFSDSSIFVLFCRSLFVMNYGWRLLRVGLRFTTLSMPTISSRTWRVVVPVVSAVSAIFRELFLSASAECNLGKNARRRYMWLLWGMQCHVCMCATIIKSLPHAMLDGRTGQLPLLPKKYWWTAIRLIFPVSRTVFSGASTALGIMILDLCSNDYVIWHIEKKLQCKAFCIWEF